MNLYTLSCIAAFTPLVGSILAGFLGWKLGRRFAHSVTIASVAISFIASAIALTHRTRRDSKYQKPGDQVKVRARDRLRVLSMPSEKREP